MTQFVVRLADDAVPMRRVEADSLGRTFVATAVQYGILLEEFHGVRQGSMLLLRAVKVGGF